MSKIQLDADLQNNIEKYGLTVRHVLGDDLNPAFSYSIGIFKSYSHPEIIIIGLKQQTAHIVINNMANDIKAGKIFTPLTYEGGILGNFDCYFIEVNKSNYDEYVGGAQRYYGNDDFPLLQCIYPTVKGIYPWESDWPENIRGLQPILGTVS